MCDITHTYIDGLHWHIKSTGKVNKAEQKKSYNAVGKTCKSLTRERPTLQMNGHRYEFLSKKDKYNSKS